VASAATGDYVLLFHRWAVAISFMGNAEIATCFLGATDRLDHVDHEVETGFRMRALRAAQCEKAFRVSAVDLLEVGGAEDPAFKNG
jgi:hypothetical protein